MQHAWKRIYSFEVACSIVKQIISHPQFNLQPSRYKLCYRYWPRVDAAKQKAMFYWLVNSGLQFAPKKSPKLFEVENLFELCTLIDAHDSGTDPLPTLKQLCRQVICSRLIESTAKRIDKDLLQTMLPLPEELCIFLADKSIKK